ncbi:hypothetical protein ACS0TY_031016 [Phlomoides rotata]
MKMVMTLLSLGVMIMSIHVAIAANHTVGGSSGWDQLTDLTTWASSLRFEEGDFLVFQYSPNHDVTEVSEADFGPCTDTNPLRPRQTGSATVIPLTSAGSRYFICTSHCLAGMKVQIDTIAASAPPPSTTASPPPAPASSPPPRTATPSPPPKNSPSPKTSPAPPSKKAANNGPTSPPSTAPPPSGSLRPPPPSSAPRFGVKGAVIGFAMMMMLLNL